MANYIRPPPLGLPTEVAIGVRNVHLITEAIAVLANSGNTNPTADDIENAINTAINNVANYIPQ